MVERHFHDIFFNGKSLADYGVHVSGDGTFNSPEKDFETVEVPGRNGDLHIFNERFKNVDLTYKAFIIGDNYPSNYGKDFYDDARSDKAIDFRARMRSLRAWLMYPNGYARLEDTYHPDEFRKALFKGPLETEAVYLQAGEFDLTFNCMPQRFLKSGEFSTEFKYTSLPIPSGTLYNPTLFESRPFVRVYGRGNLTIGDTTITIASTYPNSYIDIDCDIQDAYYGNNVNCNKYIVLNDGEFFKLGVGETDITLGEGISKIEIIPRWWTI